ncbi:phosphatase PAP2 family protein [Bradyrhizobium sp. RDM4]|uniref:phosphatase PAP2 family protein n=1 Tax=Bradyrhizobium sp. RDM4 TaxID=3378765 RepID=UPI0038FC1CF1
MIYGGRMELRITESQALWAIIAAIIGVDATWAWSLGIRVVLNPVVIPVFCLIVCINLVYATVRPDRRIAALAETIAQLIAFTSSATILSYLTVTSSFPLVDRYLAGADSVIGFDWLALFMWVHERPLIGKILFAAYDSGIFQLGVLLVGLNVLGRLERAREFVWLFVLTLSIIIPISWLLPAESAWVYFGVTDLANAYHLAHFSALRAGQMPEISMTQVNGLITFPSFHTALGAILIYATRGIRILFPIYLGLNVLMITSTPSMGGHYLVDIFAGLAVVPCAIMILRWAQKARHSQLALAVEQ